MFFEKTLLVEMFWLVVLVSSSAPRFNRLLIGVNSSEIVFSRTATRSADFFLPWIFSLESLLSLSSSASEGEEQVDVLVRF